MGKKVREELKMLQSMKASVEVEIESLQLSEKTLKQEILTKKNNLNTIKQRIINLSKSEDGLTISEHAILRYIERVMGVNIENIADKVLPADEVSMIEHLGNGHFPINNGEFKIIVKNGIVITVYTKGNKD